MLDDKSDDNRNDHEIHLKMMMIWKGCWDLVGSGSGSGTTEAVDDSNFGCSSPLGEGGQCAHACIFANTNLDK